MSVDSCTKCRRLIDTDFDPEFYVEIKTYSAVAQPVNPKAIERPEYVGLCGWCREDHTDEDGFYKS